jgi:hypothetical protein
MFVWLIERGWVRLVLLVLMGAMVLAAMTYDPPRPSEPPCVARDLAGAWDERPCPQAPARQGGEARAARTRDQ